MSNRLKTKAFTLIELLVVVAIISLLSSVVIASVSDAREKARSQALLQSLKQMMTGLELSIQNNANRYPGEVEPGIVQETWGGINYTITKNEDGTLLQEDPVGNIGSYQLETMLKPYFDINLLKEHMKTGQSIIYFKDLVEFESRCENNSEVPRFMILYLAESEDDGVPNYYSDSVGEVNPLINCLSI